MRHYIARPPMQALAMCVEYVWASRGAPAHAKERVVPTGTVELVISLVDGIGVIHDAAGRAHRTSAPSLVSGAYRRPFTFDTHEHVSVVGAHIRAGYAGIILGTPAGKLTDQHVDLEALWGRRARELREQMCAAATTEERFALLEAELLSRLEAPELHPAVGYALASLARPVARVAKIAQHMQISQRKLIEVFTSAVGVTPKRFGRIVRFHRASALARRRVGDWARIAQECGYYDQAHLIRDFHDLADVAPSALANVSRHAHEHHQLAVLDR